MNVFFFVVHNLLNKFLSNSDLFFNYIKDKIDFYVEIDLTKKRVLKIEKKKSIFLISLLLLMTTSITLLFFNLSYAEANSDLDPDPTITPFEDSYWNFTKGDTYAWEETFHINGTKMPSEEPSIYNISDIVYEYDEFDNAYYYAVKLKEMFWNASINGLQEYPIEDEDDIMDGVHINFTYNIIGSSMGPGIPYFIPKNNSDDLPLTWVAKAFNKTLQAYYTELDLISLNVDDAKNEIVIDFIIPSFGYYNFQMIYNDTGVLETVEYILDRSISGMGIHKWNITRTYNFNPIDEVEWPLEIGDVFYLGIELNETKWEVVDIIDYTDEDGDTYQGIAVNISEWDPEREEWQILQFTYGDEITWATMANEYWFAIGLVLPKGTSSHNLASIFLQILQFGTPNYDLVEYGDFWVYLEDTTTGKYCNYSYFSNGVIKYWYEGFSPFLRCGVFDEIGFECDDQFIWEIKNIDESALISIYGTEWRDELLEDHGLGENADELNAKQKFSIFEIYEDEEYYGEGWTIFYDIWSWTTDSFEDDPDDEDDQFIAEDPENVDNPTIWFCAVPVEVYLLNIDWEDDWEIDGNKIRRDYTSDGYEVNITIEFDEITGAVENFQVTNVTDDIIYEIQLIEYTPHEEEEDFYPYVCYYKNQTSILEGQNEIAFDTLINGANYKITIEIEADEDTDFLFASFPDNPSDKPLDDALLYFDLFIENASKVVFPINITIEIPDSFTSSSQILKIYYFNYTAEKWEEIDILVDGNSITFSINHASVFSMTAFTPLTPPSDDDNGNGKKRKEQEVIPGYDLFVLICTISIINMALIRKMRKLKKREL